MLRTLWHRWNGEFSFRVVYADGQQTYRMRHYECVGLAAVFHGRIVFDPYPPTTKGPP